MYKASLYLFRRDLRLQDNSALNAALTQSTQVYPCFILDRTLLDQLGGKLPRVQYLLAALKELDAALQLHHTRLHVVFDAPNSGLTRLQQACNAEAVFFNRDTGRYASRRDRDLLQCCTENGMNCHIIDDVTLHPPEQTLKDDGTPYSVFTPFFRRANQLPVKKPYTSTMSQLTTLSTNALSLDDALQEAGLQITASLSPTTHARRALEKLADLQHYTTLRDIPSLPGTSLLSASLRFGIISVREAWWAIVLALGEEHPLLRQLYWRDFFFSIGLYHPRVFSGSFHTQYNQIPWPNNETLFAAWREGRTGIPIVDAGMRELKATGYMHNRVRMITASFLVKDLHCDWRLGERYFAAQLVDYDPCINNGNWQWAASTGCDAQPYFRIFNPWTQQQKFDADCTYIKHWVPELKTIPAKTLHNLFKLDEALPGYIMPIVNHAEQSNVAKRLFESVRILK